MQDSCVTTPSDQYLLLDFGNGRRLERFGELTLDRPAPGAVSPRRISTWSADWAYTGERIGKGGWEAARAGLARHWTLRIGGQRMHCRLADAGQVGIYPEHVACWRWLRHLLRGRSGARVLNLFAATGGASLAAAGQGAEVVHLDAQSAALELARLNLGERPARLIREDAVRFAARCARAGRRFDLIVLDPPTFGRAPKGRTWSLARDLPGLLECLAGLLSERPLGVWVSVHARGWDADRLRGLVARYFSPGTVQASALGVCTPDARCLAAGVAALVEYPRHRLAR